MALQGNIINTGTPTWNGSSFSQNGSSGLPLTSWNGSSQKTEANSPTDTAQKNLAAMPDIASLTSLINSINQSAQQAANAGRIPNATGLETKSSADISAGLSGSLSPDVIAMLSQKAAERGVGGTGVGTGANVNAAYLRAMGLTSLDMQDKAQSWLTSALGRNPAAQTFNPASLLLSAAQAGSTSTGQSGQGTASTGGGGGSGYQHQPSGETARVPSNTPGSNDWYSSLFPETRTGTGATQDFSTDDWLNSIGQNPYADIEADYDPISGMRYADASDPYAGAGATDDYNQYDYLASE